MSDEINILEPSVLDGGGLLAAFELSVAEARRVGTLVEVDSALIEAGRTLAKQIDTVVATNPGGVELTKALYLTPHLVNILREMLATPASRTGVQEQVKKAKSRVSEMRERHLRTAG